MNVAAEEKNRPEGALLSARGLRKEFAAPADGWSLGATRKPGIAAVDDVSLDVFPGEVVAIVGESGSGKTTLARLLLRLAEPDAGELLFCGEDLLAAHGKRLRALRSQMQMVFQDPFSSLDPRMRVSAIVGEPLEIHQPELSRSERLARVAAALGTVGLDSAAMRRFPHEFSGGQRQRHRHCAGVDSASQASWWRMSPCRRWMFRWGRANSGAAARAAGQPYGLTLCD